MKLVIVTGMSGAGKTIALKMLEDIGFYCVDNLPISLVDKFVQLVSEGTSIEKAALGLDIRSGEELGNLDEILENWRRSNVDVQVLFLDANDAVLLNVIKRLAVPILLQVREDWKTALKKNGKNWPMNRRKRISRSWCTVR